MTNNFILLIQMFNPIATLGEWGAKTHFGANNPWAKCTTNVIARTMQSSILILSLIGISAQKQSQGFFFGTMALAPVLYISPVMKEMLQYVRMDPLRQFGLSLADQAIDGSVKLLNTALLVSIISQKYGTLAGLTTAVSLSSLNLVTYFKAQR